VDSELLNSKQLSKLIGKTEDAMYEASKNLKFEQAGRYRDQLHLLKVQLMSR
jgi:excinuclease ABC subunit B